MILGLLAERGPLHGHQIRLSPLPIAAFRCGELRLKAELRWHEGFETKLAPGTDEPRA
jgi:hypothetical protein